MDVDVLQQVNTNVALSAFFGTFIFVPVVDGRLIPRRPTEILREGRANGVRGLILLAVVTDLVLY